MLPGDAPMFFRRVPECPDGFLMGSRGEGTREEPRHRVLITEPFLIGIHQVTQAQFALWTRSEDYGRWSAKAIARKLLGDGRRHENYFKDQPDHPAERVTWHEAVAFCNWANAEYGSLLPADCKATLPAEAQWEYACRGPEKPSQRMNPETEYHTGEGEAALAEAGWYEGNSENQTQPVGGKKANAWGVHDFHGNVWEWCCDVWDARAYRKRPDGWVAREWTLADARFDAEEQKYPLRVLRGGSWGDSARFCRSSFRNGIGPDVRGRLVGFRVCLVPRPGRAERGAPETASQAEPGLETEGEGVAGTGFC